MNKIPRAITAYAVIKTKTMKLKAYDIFDSKDVKLGKDEKIIRVKIEPIIKKL